MTYFSLCFPTRSGFYPGLLLVLWKGLHLNSIWFRLFLVEHESSCPAGWFQWLNLLDDHLLLLCIYPTTRVLCSDRNHAFAHLQRRREVMEAAVISQQRHLPPIHHHPRSNFGLPCHFDHMPVLNEWVQLQAHRLAVFSLGDDGEAVLLALHRLFSILIVRLDRPIIRSLAQSRNLNLRGGHSLVNDRRRKKRIARYP